MSLICRNQKNIRRLSSRILSGHVSRHSQRTTNLSAPCLIPSSDSDQITSSSYLFGAHFHRRNSSLPLVSPRCVPQVNFLFHIKSTIDELQGPSHCWLNHDERNTSFLKKEGTYLVIAGHLLDNSQAGESKASVVFEKLKLLQQRFPQVCIMGYHSVNRGCFADDQSKMIQMIMKEYLTFPVLLSTREFSESVQGLSYIAFRDFKKPKIYHGMSTDIGVLGKALEDLLEQDNGKPRSVNIFSNTWSKQAEVIKESHILRPLQDLLLYFPGCVSADENGSRLFLSDSNHHRIIISDASGKIIDTIGCSPGFEDGEFESAKLLRPAASFYDEDEDCLYIVDSENHAIRRADFETRVLETVYPNHIEKKSNGLWTWISEKLGFRKDNEAASDVVDTRLDKVEAHSFSFPWHIMKLDEEFLVINKSFKKLWIMDLATGGIKEIVEGLPKILEVGGDLIKEKLSLIKEMPSDWLQQQTEAISSCKELLDAPLISSFTTFQDDVIMTDIVGQRALRYNRTSRSFSNLQLSNLGKLALPYWVSLPLERVYSIANGVQDARPDHTQQFRLLPGKVDIKINIEIPSNSELVEPLHESCIWRQTRGTAAEVSGAESAEENFEKVGVAQQWYDELDNLALESPETEMTVEEEDNKPSDLKFKDDPIQINSTVRTSPGTSEVVVYAALYLKLKTIELAEEDIQKVYAERIADILNPEKNRGMNHDLLVKFLLTSKRDLRDLVFMKPMHVRIHLDTLDHPKADNNKDIILTDSKAEVNVSLQQQ